MRRVLTVAFISGVALMVWTSSLVAQVTTADLVGRVTDNTGAVLPGVTVTVKNDATGIGLFEVYDLDQKVESNLGNISTRGSVGTGNDVMIGGTIVAGVVPARVLFRAIGPSLANFGVSNALEDPVLELHDGNGVLIAWCERW